MIWYKYIYILIYTPITILLFLFWQLWLVWLLSSYVFWVRKGAVVSVVSGFDFQRTPRLCPELPSKVNLEILAANTKIAEACSQLQFLTDLCYPFCFSLVTNTMPRGISPVTFFWETQTSSSNFFLPGLNYLPGIVSLNALSVNCSREILKQESLRNRGVLGQT